MSTDHGHGHGGAGAHAHAPTSGTGFAVGIALNLGIVVLEVVYGLISHSMALLADAGHNLGDVLGLALSGLAVLLAKRRPTTRHTYGLRRTSILAALANALLLVGATGAVAWEAIQHLIHPEPVEPGPMILVAGIAVVVNGASALLFLKGREHDVNVKSAFMHLAGDALIALGVVGAGLVIRATGWVVLDPIASLLIAVAILAGTFSLLKTSVNLAVDAVPDAIDLDSVRGYLASLEHIDAVHDLHVWPLSTTETALTAHLVTTRQTLEKGWLHEVREELNARFEIRHVTIQLEPAEGCLGCDAPTVKAPEGSA
jgi:cobalt-zinc-cadmium efflux system protein